MPRYRYKKAFFSSPKIGERLVTVQRISDAIAVLRALGSGDLTVEAEECRDDIQHRPRVTLPIHHLLRKNDEAIQWLIDSEIDVARALTYPMKGRKVDPADRGRWPFCPPDIQAVLIGMPHDGIYRLRHFGALMIAKISIGSRLGVRERERAALDAGLTETETIIAYHAERSSGCRDLLYLR